tara:strand:+ start:764 stop:1342 length:579 start_codon:yes stop_codon:yes gene_type:complete
MARKRGGFAGLYDKTKKVINPVFNAAQFVGSGPLGLYNSRLLTQEGGGLKKVINDPLYQAQVATVAGGLAARGAGAGGGAAAGGTDTVTKNGGGGKLAGLFTGVGKFANKLKGYEDTIGKVAGGIQAERKDARADEQARLAREETARMFDEQQKLRVRQQANLDQDAMMTKQQFDELNANRAKLRAILTGGM